MKPILSTLVVESHEHSHRNDSGVIVERRDGSWMVAWDHFYNQGAQSGDLDACNISRVVSRDRGRTWGDEKVLVEKHEGDANVQVPGLLRLPDGTILLHYLRAHAVNSSSMFICRSEDDGETFGEPTPIWEHSKGQWLQGGAAGLYPLRSGRLILPFHGGSGDQFSQVNIIRCFISDDSGHTFRMAPGVIRLPMRGAMEGTIAETAGGRLFMAMRTQLGSVFLSCSDDQGETWSMAQTTGLHAPESCPRLGILPDSNTLFLVFNHSLYDPTHHHFGVRTPLSIAVSPDEGRTWKMVGDLLDVPGEFGPTDAKLMSTGELAILYTHNLLRDPKDFGRSKIDCGLFLIDPEELVRAARL